VAAVQAEHNAGSAPRGSAPGWPLAPRVPALASVIGSVIELVVASVEWLLTALPSPVPTAGRLRHARGRGGEQLSRVTSPVRRPVLAGIGTADLIIHHGRAALTGQPR
jgi:hypothetical protein